MVPPDPISNSEVKRLSADDSVGFPHVKVGHCQALNPKAPNQLFAGSGLFLCRLEKRNYIFTTISIYHVSILLLAKLDS